MANSQDDSELTLDDVLGRSVDEVGAETLARFRYQCEVAARHCFAMLPGGNIVAVVCEWHEDYLVLFEADVPLLASVKHRESPRGPWRIGELMDDALRPLFRRWQQTGEKARCLLATNAGLAPGPGEARELKQACADTDVALLAQFARDHCARLGADDATAARFLTSLSLDDDLPGRLDIAASQTTYLLRPVLRQLRMDELRAEEAYEGVVELVMSASRQTFGSRLAMFAYVNDPTRLRTDAAAHELLRRRTILPEDVSDRVRRAITAGAAELVPRRPRSDTTLVAKLEAGGLGPTTVAAAQRLRAIWSEFEARYRSDLPGGDDEFEDLRTRVLSIAADAEAAAQAATADGSPYGLRMHAAAMGFLDDPGAVVGSPLRLDRHQLRGLLYQLTDECHVWWAARDEDQAHAAE